MGEARLKALKDAEIDRAPVMEATVAVLGYGSQGRSHALNLRDSGVRVVVGQRPGGRGWEAARADGWDPMPVDEAAAHGDFVVFGLPEREHAPVFERAVRPVMRASAALVFIHGFTIRFGLLVPPPGCDVILAAPKGVGPEVRRAYESGSGVPVLIGVHQDASGAARRRALAYAAAIGGGRVGVLETTFADECETDLFGEQAVLCGGLPELMRTAFDTLVEAGYPPELAYFECCHEVKLIADMMYRVGVEGLTRFISDTAALGGATRGPRLVDDETRRRMRVMLEEIRSGKFAREYAEEGERGGAIVAEAAARDAGSALAETGSAVRKLLGIGEG